MIFIAFENNPQVSRPVPLGTLELVGKRSFCTFEQQFSFVGKIVFKNVSKKFLHSHYSLTASLMKMCKIDNTLGSVIDEFFEFLFFLGYLFLGDFDDIFVGVITLGGFSQKFFGGSIILGWPKLWDCIINLWGGVHLPHSSFQLSNIMSTSFFDPTRNSSSASLDIQALCLMLLIFWSGSLFFIIYLFCHFFLASQLSRMANISNMWYVIDKL